MGKFRAGERSAREVIVITGASAGIGRAAARAFARPGACIALLARGVHGLQGASREVRAAGGEALIIPTDVADAEQVESAAAKVEQAWGGIDIWVNNAITTVFSSVSELNPSDLKRATEVAYLGAAYGTMSALRRMRRRNRGVIVQVGSALSYRAIPLQAAYCAAKHAMRAFTDSVRCELLHDCSDIHVTMVHLSAFNTPQFDWSRNLMGRRARPLAPIFQPEIAGRAIVWAARHRRREVFVGWPAVKAVVANKIAPGWLDRILANTAYEGQLGDEPLSENRCENLCSPCDGDAGADAGAHGRFDDASRNFSLQWFWTSKRGALLTAAASLTLLGAVWALRRPRHG